MRIIPILMALFLVPAVAVWSAGCDDGGNGNGDNGGSGSSGAGGSSGSSGTGGSGGFGGTGGTDCIPTGSSGCDPDIGGFGECCDYPDSYCTTEGICQGFT